MESLIKADIFFFVTTIAIACVSTVLIVISVYIVKILREVFKIAEKAKMETDNIVSDIRDLRETIREEGSKLKSISDLLTRFVPQSKKHATSRAKQREKTEETINE